MEELRHRRRSFLAVLLAGSLLAVLGASPARAVVARLADGRTISYQPLRGAAAIAPFDQFFTNLDYNGGPVMASNTNYAIYWQPSGAPSYPADYRPGLNRYFEDLAHDSGGTENVDSVSAQYNDTAGEFAKYDAHFGGALVDTTAYPPNGCTRAPICLTDAQLRAELKSFVEANGLPRDLTHEYFLLTPPSVEDCFEKAGNVCSAGSERPVYCAYHGNIPAGEGQIIYSNDPYVTGILGCDDGNHPNGTSSDGALQGGLSHEHNESITDPEPNNAWTDFGGIEGEIGDKCAGANGAALGTASNGASYNQVVNGHFYWYQQEWSNQTHQCLQRLTFSGEEPTATFTSTAGAGNEMSFDATGSTAPGGVARYNWQFNDGLGGSPSTPTETTTPSVSHTFPAGGKYVVALTVFASDGTSIGTSRTLTVGKPPTPAVVKVTPAKGPAAGGTSVTITGKNLAEATSVSFGTTPAASFKAVSATTLTAVSPAESAGIVDVTVTSPGGTSALVLTDHFKFGPPTISAVSPNNGPAAGGTSLTVTGTGFAPGTTATSFKFALSPAASVNCSSLTECTVVSPPHKAGLVDLRATVSKIVSPKTAADQFTYH
ncbi:MAG TPA: IPT/TIG domain-containing protein [Solirubrobacteraceae bacterium]|nr:IPT/TIG domain-containing protein [Solirubrobacteraceae bacterium]